MSATMDAKNSSNDGSTDGVNIRKRRFLIAATSGIAAVGAATMAVPFLTSWAPSERAKAAGAPVEADLSKMAFGQQLTVGWRGKPVWIVRRTEETLANLEGLAPILRDPNSEAESQQPGYAQNLSRAIKPEYGVFVGICTHLGCSPTYRPELGAADLGEDWKGAGIALVMAHVSI